MLEGKMKVEEVLTVIAPEQQEQEAPRMFLSNLDLRLGFYSRAIFFYKMLPFHNFLHGVLVPSLVSALQKALPFYSFFCGRLEFDSKGRLHIVCNNKGMNVAVAFLDAAIDELQDDVLEELFYQPLVDSLEDMPLLTVQVTELKDGVCAIAGLFHHTLGDATTSMQFMKNLAMIARGKKLPVVPNPDRTMFRARTPPCPVFDHPEFTLQVHHATSRFTVTPEAVLNSEIARRSIVPTKRKEYTFRLEHLEKLKDDAVRHGATSCTKFDVLAALVWKIHGTSFGKPRGETMQVRFLVNVRNVLIPPLGNEFCGNAAYGTVASATVDELAGETIGATVRRIQQAKERITDAYVRSGFDFLEQHPQHWYPEDCHTIINSWPKFMGNSLHLDFGLGNPLKIKFPLDSRNRSILFLPLLEDGYIVSVPNGCSLFEERLEQLSG